MISNRETIEKIQEALTLLRKGKNKIAVEQLVNLIAELRENGNDTD